MLGRDGLAALLAVAAFLAASCGSESDGQLQAQNYPGVGEQLVTAQDVSRVPADMPAHTVLDWWRASQFASRDRFLQLLAKNTRLRIEARKHLDQELDYFAGALRVARPKVVATEVEGDRATVFTVVTFHQPVGSTRFVKSTRPQAFTLVRELDGWRIADDHFFLVMIQALVDQRPAAGF